MTGALPDCEGERASGTADPPRLDPVLAFVDFVEYYRRSLACWDIGGPAAVDALRIVGSGRTAGARLVSAGAWLAGHDTVLPAPDTTLVAQFILRALHTPGCNVPLDATAVWTGSAAESLAMLPASMRERVVRLADPSGRYRPRDSETGGRRAICVAEGGFVQLQFAGYGWQFVKAGTGPRAQAGLAHHYGLVTRRVFSEETGRPCARMPQPNEFGLALEGGPRATWDRGVGIFFASLGRSVVNSRPSLTVVVGPDTAASGRLFALFLHLSGFAGRHRPEAGGVVEDGCYPAFLPMLAGEPPAWSSACHLRLGRESGAQGLMRVVHLVLPAGPHLRPIHRRVLARAERVWVVMPERGDGQECLGAILGTARRARVTLVSRTGAAAAFGRPEMELALDVPLRCERYLGGAVSPEESAAFVRLLLARDGTRSA